MLHDDRRAKLHAKRIGFLLLGFRGERKGEVQWHCDDRGRVIERMNDSVFVLPKRVPKS